MSAAQLFLPASRAFNSNGLPVAGAVLKLYTTETLIPQPFYSDGALTVSLGSSVTANAAGRFGTVYQDNSSPFRLRIEDSSGAELDDIDPFYFGSMLVGTAYNAVTPQNYGALADGVTDDSAAFVAAIAALRAEALNTGGSGFYKGSRSLFIPAGHYYLGTTALDIEHTLAIQGEGSGQFGPQAGGCSRLRWAAATDGIRVQGTNTSGNTTVDITTHDGSGGVTLGDLCLEGGFNGTTESDHHGLVIRNAVKAENLYIKNFPGEGVKAWAGNVIGNGTVGGNVSTTRLIGVKCEDNRGGFDIRGSDANVVTLINCEGYQNRWFGYLDDNGAGSNTNIGMHCASNGLVTGTWSQTQCSNSGNHYAAKWGGNPTVAPSGDTTDTANWLYIEPGFAVANLIPAWVNTPNTFRAGGDYLTLNSASAHIDNCYSEGGGFSQFNAGTLITHGTIGYQYSRGGYRIFPLNDGLALRISPACKFYLDSLSGESQILARDSAFTEIGFLDWSSGGLQLATAYSTVYFKVAGSFVATIDSSGNYAGTGSVKSSSPSAGVGYATGAGGAVTQITSRTTSTPQINKLCGQITLFSAAGSASWQTFTVPNTTVAATDVIRVVQASGTDKYMIHITKVVAGTSFDISFATTGGTTTEAPVFNFAVLKAVAA